MNTLATSPSTEREAYFGEAAARRGLAGHIIEKDFWVCWTLRHLFALETVADDLLFKGGTSLSKVYGLIQRFSEDIDLSIHRSSLGFEGESDPVNLSGKPRERKIKELGKAAKDKIADEILPELKRAFQDQLGEKGWDLQPDEDDKDEQTLSFTYPRTNLTLSPAAYLKPAVKIEFGVKADHVPAERKTIRPYLSEEIPEALDEPEVEVKVIDCLRTFWEKATILHQMAHLDPTKPIRKRYSRHYCDLASMIERGLGHRATRDEAQDLLKAVKEHKLAFYRSAWANYETAVRGTLRLIPSEKHLSSLAEDLELMREMFFDDPPQLEDVLRVLRTWEQEFNRTN